MKVNKSRIIKAAVLFLGLFAFDLLTKSLAVNALQDGRHIPLISGVLEFYYIQNRGAAFGIFQNGTFQHISPLLKAYRESIGVP